MDYARRRTGTLRRCTASDRVMYETLSNVLVIILCIRSPLLHTYETAIERMLLFASEQRKCLHITRLLWHTSKDLSMSFASFIFF
jgi:hypothetical protein